MASHSTWLPIFLLTPFLRISIQSSIILVQDATEDCSPCYRRLLNGKKTVQIHVRRALECRRIEECHRACDYEKYFPCQGFNYRRMGSGSRGMCEMISMPYSRMDVHRDFIADPQCDYYDKDPDCPRDTGNRPSWTSYPSRPGQTYIPGSEESSGRPVDPFKFGSPPYVPDRRPPSEIPRPLDYNPRPVYHKVDSGRPIDIPRPIDNRPQVYGSSYGSFGEPFYHRPSSAPDGRPIDNYNGNGYSYGRPQYSRPTYNVPIERPYPSKMYPDRRVDYNPYNDIGTNEIGPYSPDRRKDHRDWPIYGSSYGYDTNYVGQFDIPKYYPKHPPQGHYQPMRPQEDDHFYGEFYNYGGAFGYGGNYIPPGGDRDQFYGGTKKGRRCTMRAGVGVKLGRSVVRKTYLTPNLEECESLCLNEKSFLCMTLGYRYNVAPTDPTDNCLLSEVSYKDLNFYTDIEPNRNYDVYVIIGDSRTCGMMMQQHHHPPDECFWRVRSGFGMPSDVIRKSISVDDLGECQVECTLAREFTCRSFAFKYGLGSVQRTPATNCFLSDWPTQDINPTTMPDMDGAELYERGSFGRGCEPYPFPPFKIGGNSKFPRGEDVCYSGYHKPCRLTPYSVMLSVRVDSENQCRERCSKMRQRDPTPCMSFSYKIKADRREQNCLLSDVSIRDLRPGLDYSYDDDHVLYAWKDLEPQCMMTGYSIDDNHVFGSPGHGHGRPLPPPPPGRPDLSHGSDQSDGIYIPDPRPFYGHDISRPFDIGPHHGLRPYDPDRPDPDRPPVDRPYGPPGAGHNDHGNDYGFNFQGSYEQDNTLPPSPELSTSQHYTVNGYPCKRGTKCERNSVAGFWSCETEGGEFGSWDYCCEPNHHCGYSQGYHYQWCYVGISEDQWRPCSEKYYPYLPSSRPIQYSGHHGDSHRDHTDLNYFARHWPVTYLHKEPPPNCTDSLASADNARDRRLNETSSVRSKEDDSKNNNRTARLRSRAIRRLRSRVIPTNDTENVSRRSDNDHDGRILFSGKIGSQLSTGTVPSNSERFGRVERITKLNSNVPRFDSMPIVVPFVTKQNGRHMERSVKMIAPISTAIIGNNNESKGFANLTSNVPNNSSNSMGTTEGFILKVN
ncbi:hypothetical protein KPH14_006185 [Odynerus spinipes]|uniref:Apple domain-containing protein n=1 Tax=Odynerus spinipes TaxID=1348599 RepID=A0AAD9VMP3_9HYME|nr:hypothetical protein KPH14_006185 [Odynerus spinipes]